MGELKQRFLKTQMKKGRKDSRILNVLSGTSPSPSSWRTLPSFRRQDMDILAMTRFVVRYFQ